MKTIALSDETIVLQTVLEVDNYTNRQLVCKNTTFFSEMLVSASLKSCFSLIACCLWLLYRLFANSLFQIQRFYVFSQGKSILHQWQIACSPKVDTCSPKVDTYSPKTTREVKIAENVSSSPALSQHMWHIFFDMWHFSLKMWLIFQEKWLVSSPR